SSGDLIADRRFEFARDLRLKGDLAAAADLLEQATEPMPNFASAWFTLGEIREQLGQRAAAENAFRKAFTAETHDADGVVIGEGLRYAHGADYLRKAIAAAGLKLAHLEGASARIEDNRPVPGLVAVATKP